MEPVTHDQDFHAWAKRNAELIRRGKLSEIDGEYIAEELENMGKSQKRELVNRLSVLLAHLLKWQYQPDKRSNSWVITRCYPTQGNPAVAGREPQLEA